MIRSVEMRRLDEVAIIDRRSIQPHQIPSGCLFVGLENIESTGSFHEVLRISNGEIKSTKFAFDERHILFGKLRPYLRKIARPEFAGICSTDILPILPLDMIDRGYLYHYLRTQYIVALATQRSTGANLPRLSPKDLAQFPVPVPAIAEQRHIASVLDRIAQIEELRRNSITRLDLLQESLYSHKFSNACEWPRLTLVELCLSADDIRCGPFGTQLSQTEYTNTGVPLWGIKHVNNNFSQMTIEFVTSEKAERLNNYSLEPGDIVMTRKGTVGNCSVYPLGYPRGIMHSDLLRLRVNKSVCHPIFLSHQLKFSDDVQSQIKVISRGAVMAGINVTKLKKLQIFLPPLSIQLEFIAAVEQLNKAKSLSLSSQERLKELALSAEQNFFFEQASNSLLASNAI